MYDYSAKVERVVDGDTIEVDLDLGFDVHVKASLRLYGVDTPEKFGLTKEAGLKSKAYVEGWLKRTIMVQTIKDDKEKFGRYLAIIHDASEPLSSVPMETLNDALVREGLAKAYFGGKRT